MPKFKIDENGNLLDAEGNVVKLDNEPIVVEGARTQAQVDQAIQERLARERENHRKWKEAAEKIPEFQRQAEEAATRVRELEEQAVKAREAAQAEAQAQLSKLAKDADTYRQKYEQEARERLQFEVRTAILSAAKDRFNDPGIDVVPHLLQAHKREEVKGEDGKPTGAFQDFFKLRYKGEKGEEVEEWLPLDKALEIWVAAHPHHVRASGSRGSGGDNYHQFDVTGNPWAKGHENLTAQHKLIAQDRGKAVRMMGEAGVPVPDYLTNEQGV